MLRGQVVKWERKGDEKHLYQYPEYSKYSSGRLSQVGSLLPELLFFSSLVLVLVF